MHSQLNNVDSGAIPQPESEGVVHQPVNQTSWSILCLTVAAGVTCTDHGTYIVYTFYTGDVGWGPHTLGTFTRPVTVANLGVWFNASVHEKSIYEVNRASGNVSIHPFGTGAYSVLPSITPSGPGLDVIATGAGADFRSVYSAANYPIAVNLTSSIDRPTTDTYLIGEIYIFSDGFAIPDESTYCPACGNNYTLASAFDHDPIDLRTGNFSYPVDDLSLPSSDGPLSFRRMYISQATDKYIAPLGYGWTHSQDIRLVFPIDPAGQAEYVLFKDQSGNMYYFLDHGNETYSPYPGLNATLVKNGGMSVTYTIEKATQDVYQFDCPFAEMLSIR